MLKSTWTVDLISDLYDKSGIKDATKRPSVVAVPSMSAVCSIDLKMRALTLPHPVTTPVHAAVRACDLIDFR